MCTGSREVFMCPCNKAKCPKRDDIRKPSNHVIRHSEPEPFSWDYCDWWFANGDPALVLDRYVKPLCPHIQFHETKKMDQMCNVCRLWCCPAESMKKELAGDTTPKA